MPWLLVPRHPQGLPPGSPCWAEGRLFATGPQGIMAGWNLSHVRLGWNTMSICALLVGLCLVAVAGYGDKGQPVFARAKVERPAAMGSGRASGVMAPFVVRVRGSRCRVPVRRSGFRFEVHRSTRPQRTPNLEPEPRTWNQNPAP